MSPFRHAFALPLCAAALSLPAASLAADPARAAQAAASQAPAKAAKSDGAPAKAAVATLADPMEALRIKLAEKLSSGRGSAASAARDSRSASRHAAAAASAPARHAATAGHGAAANAHMAAAPAHWDYNGPGGPQAWGGLRPEFSLCASGQRQSPIDIREGLAVDLEPVHFEYHASRFAVLDNGHTVQVNVAPGNTIEVGGRRFELQQFHFHRPAEERIGGQAFEMSVHFVHRDEQGRLAVVTVLLAKGPAQPAVQKVWNNLPLERNEEAAARLPLELLDLLPADRGYYTYMGSLTTPPCSEGVQWIVMRQPVTVSPEQIEIFARIYPMNARPLQPASGRRIMQSN